jgi:hypothetical protein
MNKRIKKKKYDKWRVSRMNCTIPFEDMSFIFDLADAMDIKKPYLPNPMFRELAASRNVFKAVRYRCKNTIWKNEKCKNIDNMYAEMCRRIHGDRLMKAYLMKENQRYINE